MTTIANRYELGDVIGSGGMSEVFDATDTLLGRSVAVKMLRADMARDANFRERFRREAQNAGRLNHPAIVAVYDTGEATIAGLSVPYIVMERVFGRTLRDIIREDGPMSPEDAAATLIPVCEALEASHEAGIIHRDIKPANIMITNTGSVKVMDFGIARALDDSTSAMTQTSAVIGTAQYLSPEQARGKAADGRSDLYALGCVLYEMLTGRPPFEGETPFAVAYQHVQEEAQPPSHFMRDLTPTAAVNVDAVVLTAMAKHPADRYQTAADMRDDLELLSRGAVTAAAKSHIAPGAVNAHTATLENPPTQTLLTGDAIAGVGTGGAGAATHAAPVSYRGATSSGGGGGRRRRKKSPAWPKVTAAVLAMVVLVGGGAYAVTTLIDQASNQADGAIVTLPDVVGQSRAQAQQTLEELGFLVDVNEEPSPDVTRGQVIRSNPVAGSQLQSGTTVVLAVSSGREITDVPSLNGMSVDQARAALEQAGLELNPQVQQDYSESVAEGNVMDQNPPAGSQISKGSQVSVTVSQGQETVRVPDVAGMTLSEAESTLSALGFTVTPTYVDSRDPENRVTQVPQAGQSTQPGQSIEIQVSRGNLVAMPDLSRMTRTQAIDALRAAGWVGSESNVTDGATVATAALGDVDLVAATNPPAGGDLNKQAQVQLRFYRFDISAIGG